MCRKDLPQSVIFTAHRGLPCIETRSQRIETFVNADLSPHIAPSCLPPLLRRSTGPSWFIVPIVITGKPGVGPNAVCAASALTCYIPIRRANKLLSGLRIDDSVLSTIYVCIYGCRDTSLEVNCTAYRFPARFAVDPGKKCEFVGPVAFDLCKLICRAYFWIGETEWRCWHCWKEGYSYSICWK